MALGRARTVGKGRCVQRVLLCLLCLFSLAGAGETTNTDSALAGLPLLAEKNAPRWQAISLSLRDAEGALREARGAFDPALQFNGSLDIARGELLPVSIRQQFQSRFLLEQLDESFSRTADNLQAQLDSDPGPVVFECAETIIVINGQEVCDTPQAARQRRALLSLLTSLTGSAPDQAQLIALQQIRDEALRNNRTVIAETIAQLRRVAASSRNSRARLGDIPGSERRVTASVDLGYRLRGRSGISFTPQLLLEGVDDTFESKPRNPSDGGKGLQRVYRSALGASLSIPLGRGGRALSASEEDGARLRREAARATAQGSLQRLHRDLLTSYVALAAARAREAQAAARIERSAALSATVTALIDAGELAAAQGAQTTALLAQNRAVQGIALRLRLAAERQLAELLGTDLEGATGLHAGMDSLEAMASLPRCAGGPARWRAAALAQRPDLDAARWRLRAAERLSAAADDLLLPRVDLGITLAYGGREERFNVGEGYAHALFDSLAGPSIQVTLSGELAVRNEAARGQQVQALALIEQARQQLADAERSIQRGLSALHLQLRTGASTLALRERAALAYRQAHQTQTELVRRGESGLLETLASEAQLDQAELALIDASESQARLLIELRFQLGRLVLPSRGPAGLAWLRQQTCASDASA